MQNAKKMDVMWCFMLILLLSVSSYIEDSLYHYYDIDSVYIEDISIEADSLFVDCKYLHNGKNALNIRLFRDDNYADTTIVVDINMYIWGWKAKRNMKMYHIIKNGDVERVMVPYNSKILRRYIIGKEVKKSLNRGRVLRVDDVGDITLVKKGEKSYMLLESKGISIKKIVHSMNDGCFNDTIIVVDEKGKYFLCVVYDDYLKMIGKIADKKRKKRELK